MSHVGIVENPEKNITYVTLLKDLGKRIGGILFPKSFNSFLNLLIHSHLHPKHNTSLPNFLSTSLGSTYIMASDNL